MRLERHRSVCAVAGAHGHLVIDEVELDVEGSLAGWNRRRRQSARAQVERGLPPVVFHRRERQPRLADNLGPAVQRGIGVLPGARAAAPARRLWSTGVLDNCHLGHESTQHSQLPASSFQLPASASPLPASGIRGPFTAPGSPALRVGAEPHIAPDWLRTTSLWARGGPARGFNGGDARPGPAPGLRTEAAAVERRDPIDDHPGWPDWLWAWPAKCSMRR